MFIDNKYLILFDLDISISNYKNIILEPLFKNYRTGLIHYNEYYKSKKYNIYWSLIKLYNNIYKELNF